MLQHLHQSATSVSDGEMEAIEMAKAVEGMMSGNFESQEALRQIISSGRVDVAVRLIMFDPPLPIPVSSPSALTNSAGQLCSVKPFDPSRPAHQKFRETAQFSGFMCLKKMIETFWPQWQEQQKEELKEGLLRLILPPDDNGSHSIAGVCGDYDGRMRMLLSMGQSGSSLPSDPLFSSGCPLQVSTATEGSFPSPPSSSCFSPQELLQGWHFEQSGKQSPASSFPFSSCMQLAECVAKVAIRDWPQKWYHLLHCISSSSLNGGLNGALLLLSRSNKSKKDRSACDGRSNPSSCHKRSSPGEWDREGGDNEFTIAAETAMAAADTMKRQMDILVTQKENATMEDCSMVQTTVGLLRMACLFVGVVRELAQEAGDDASETLPLRRRREVQCGLRTHAPLILSMIRFFFSYSAPPSVSGSASETVFSATIQERRQLIGLCCEALRDLSASSTSSLIESAMFLEYRLDQIMVDVVLPSQHFFSNRFIVFQFLSSISKDLGGGKRSKKRHASTISLDHLTRLCVIVTRLATQCKPPLVVGDALLHNIESMHETEISIANLVRDFVESNAEWLISRLDTQTLYSLWREGVWTFLIHPSLKICNIGLAISTMILKRLPLQNSGDVMSSSSHNDIPTWIGMEEFLTLLYIRCLRWGDPTLSFFLSPSHRSALDDLLNRITLSFLPNSPLFPPDGSWAARIAEYARWDEENETDHVLHDFVMTFAGLKSSALIAVTALAGRSKETMQRLLQLGLSLGKASLCSPVFLSRDTLPDPLIKSSTSAPSIHSDEAVSHVQISQLPEKQLPYLCAPYVLLDGICGFFEAAIQRLRNATVNQPLSIQSTNQQSQSQDTGGDNSAGDGYCRSASLAASASAPQAWMLPPSHVLSPSPSSKSSNSSSASLCASQSQSQASQAWLQVGASLYDALIDLDLLNPPTSYAHMLEIRRLEVIANSALFLHYRVVNVQKTLELVFSRLMMDHSSAQPQHKAAIDMMMKMSSNYANGNVSGASRNTDGLGIKTEGLNGMIGCKSDDDSAVDTNSRDDFGSNFLDPLATIRRRALYTLMTLCTAAPHILADFIMPIVKQVQDRMGEMRLQESERALLAESLVAAISAQQNYANQRESISRLIMPYVNEITQGPIRRVAESPALLLESCFGNASCWLPSSSSTSTSAVDDQAAENRKAIARTFTQVSSTIRRTVVPTDPAAAQTGGYCVHVDPFDIGNDARNGSGSVGLRGSNGLYLRHPLAEATAGVLDVVLQFTNSYHSLWRCEVRREAPWLVPLLSIGQEEWMAIQGSQDAPRAKRLKTDCPHASNLALQQAELIFPIPQNYDITKVRLMRRHSFHIRSLMYRLVAHLSAVPESFYLHQSLLPSLQRVYIDSIDWIPASHLEMQIKVVWEVICDPMSCPSASEYDVVAFLRGFLIPALASASRRTNVEWDEIMQLNRQISRLCHSRKEENDRATSIYFLRVSCTNCLSRRILSLVNQVFHLSSPVSMSKSTMTSGNLSSSQNLPMSDSGTASSDPSTPRNSSSSAASVQKRTGEYKYAVYTDTELCTCLLQVLLQGLQWPDPISITDANRGIRAYLRVATTLFPPLIPCSLEICGEIMKAVVASIIQKRSFDPHIFQQSSSSSAAGGYGVEKACSAAGEEQNTEYQVFLKATSTTSGPCLSATFATTIYDILYSMIRIYKAHGGMTNGGVNSAHDKTTGATIIVAKGDLANTFQGGAGRSLTPEVVMRCPYISSAFGLLKMLPRPIDDYTLGEVIKGVVEGDTKGARLHLLQVVAANLQYQRSLNQQKEQGGGSSQESVLPPVPPIADLPLGSLGGILQLQQQQMSRQHQQQDGSMTMMTSALLAVMGGGKGGKGATSAASENEVVAGSGVDGEALSILFGSAGAGKGNV